MNMRAIEIHPLVQQIRFTEDRLIVLMADGRTIMIPLAWFPRLSNATIEQLQKYETIGDGEGIHWPDIDEDLSARGLLLGVH